MTERAGWARVTTQDGRELKGVVGFTADIEIVDDGIATPSLADQGAPGRLDLRSGRPSSPERHGEVPQLRTESRLPSPKGSMGARRDGLHDGIGDPSKFVPGRGGPLVVDAARPNLSPAELEQRMAEVKAEQAAGRMAQGEVTIGPDGAATIHVTPKDPQIGDSRRRILDREAAARQPQLTHAQLESIRERILNAQAHGVLPSGPYTINGDGSYEVGGRIYKAPHLTVPTDSVHEFVLEPSDGHRELMRGLALTYARRKQEVEDCAGAKMLMEEMRRLESEGVVVQLSHRIESEPGAPWGAKVYTFGMNPEWDG